jgi:hypothetical protein
MTKRLALLSMLVVTTLLFGGSANATQPSKGTYVVYHQRVSATPSCAIQAGAVWTSYFYYPGPLKTGAEMKLEYDVATNAALLQLSAYPATPAAGAALWSGTFTETTLPPTTTVTKSFNINITYGDAKSWLWDRTVTAGACNASDKIVLVRTGA